MTAQEAQKDIQPRFVCVPGGLGIKDGDKITIAGVRLYPDGAVTNNCNANEVTTFIARVSND